MKELNFKEGLRKSFADNGSNISIMTPKSSMTYRELGARAEALRRTFAESGVPSGAIIAIYILSREEAIAAIIAAMLHDCGYLPLDPIFPPERLAYMVSNADCRYLVSDNDSFVPADVSVFDVNKNAWIQEGKKASPNSQEDLGYVIYTSGSTGKPKGVMLGRSVLSQLIAWQNSRYGQNERWRTAQFSSLSFDVSFQEIISTLLLGATLYLVPPQTKQDFRALVEFVQQHQIQRLFMPYIALLNFAQWACRLKCFPSSLREVVTAGEQLVANQEIRELFRQCPKARLYNQYGPSESHVVTEYALPENVDDWPEIPPIGKAIPNAQIFIVDNDMHELPSGEEGELLIGGSVLASGYKNNPEETEKRFVEITLGGHLQRVYRTGDTATKDEEGIVHYKGRIDNQIKISGYRVELSEVEAAIMALPDIEEAAVTVTGSDSGKKELIAFSVVKKTKEGIAPEELKSQLSQHLPVYMVPKHWEFLPELERTVSGKIDRKSMVDRWGNEQQDLRLSTGDLQQQVLGILRRDLSNPALEAHDNLVEQGMDSLAANRISASCFDDLGLDLPAYRLFQFRDVGTLLASLNKNKSKAKTTAFKKTKGSSERRIAIIGASLNVPGARSLEEFWELLVEGKEAISFGEVSEPGEVNARGLIDGYAEFDAGYFSILPGEAEFIDPQQRQLLELAVHSLEDAGYSPERFSGRIGVYCGTGNNSYYLNNVLKNSPKLEEFGAFQAMIANEKDYSATRIAHKLNLTGPAVSIQTACSTSLVAICQAVNAIRSGECDMALAGAASISFPQKQVHTYEEGGILSEDGHTRAFDASATGTVFSDGAAVLVLKRLDYALADGDKIIASIDGVALNNDGADKGSFSAPSIEGQKRVVVNAQQDAGISAEKLGYIEAHGTATPLGDPIEVAALSEAFSLSTDTKQFCVLGSVKSNFGHLTAAAGAVGVLKTALSIQKGIIPASINFDRPNPSLNIESTPFSVAHKKTHWKKEKLDCIAGVSSFGVGGTNAHAILRGVEYSAETVPHNLPPLPLCLSAKSPEALLKLAKQYSDLLEENPDLDLSLLAQATLQQRTEFAWRFACYGVSYKALSKRLKVLDSDEFGHGLSPRNILFLFPGQGAQVVGMGKLLYEKEPVFRRSLDKCAEASQSLGIDLLAILFQKNGELNYTANTQLALFSVGFALAEFLAHKGIKPSALLGHSIGELVAATIAGVWDLQTAVQVVVWRGQLMAEQPEGSMAAVRCSLETLESLLPEGVSIAAVNASEACTISGESTALKEAITLLQAQGIKCTPLDTSHAFHSPMMKPAADAYAKKLSNIEFQIPQRRFISCVTGDWITDQQAMDPNYWASQILSPVQFSKGCGLASKLENVVAIELGPRRVASGLMALAATESDIQLPVVPLLVEAGTEHEYGSFLNSLGKLWQFGALKLEAECEFNTRRFISLPSYPFVRETYEIKAIDPFNAASFNKSRMPIIASAHTTDVKIDMKTSIVTELKTLFSDLSGMDLKAAANDAGFFELGLDSLFLTQSIGKLKKRYKVNISFRQLMSECNSFDSLASHLEKEGGSVESPQPSSEPSAPGTLQHSPPITGQPINGDLVTLMQQQLQLISNQMGLLSNAGVAQPALHSGSTAPLPSLQTSPEKPNKPFGAGTRINVKRTNEISAGQQEHLKALTERYTRKFVKSKTFAQENRKQLADPRVVSGFRNTIKELIFPVVVERSHGANLWDIDGNTFIDVTCGFGSNFFGNGADFIREAIIEQLNKGYEIGPQHPLVAEVSKRLCAVTGNERVAFCNTGSEAVLGAVRLARTVTAKEQIVMFENDYHGINDEVIVHRGGDGYSAPAAAGVPEAAVSNTMILDYGESPSLDYIREHAESIAAVVVEPVQSRNPNLQPKEFLHTLRKLCDDNEIALIFDEVITGFRIHPRGAQGFYDIQADICTYGKVIGGGMPLGVIAGKADYMDALDGGQWQFGDDSQPEVGVTYFAGTFVRHPPALAAANAVLKKLASEPNLQADLNAKADAMVAELNEYFDSVGAPIKTVNCGSLFRFAIPQNIAYEELIYVLLREKGIHIWDARPCFLTLAHSDNDIAQFVSAVKQSVDEMLAMTFFEADPAKAKKSNSSVSFDATKPPVPGARLGKDPSGNPAWYIADPKNPGKFLMVGSKA